VSQAKKPLVGGFNLGGKPAVLDARGKVVVPAIAGTHWNVVVSFIVQNSCFFFFLFIFSQNLI
jgi:hypothetical protein